MKKGTYVIYSTHLSNDSADDVVAASARLADHLRGMFPGVDVVVRHGVEGSGAGWQGEDEDGIGEDMDSEFERFDCFAK